jgi:hypothetical protein
MFTRLRLTHFKAWTDTGDIALKPVTMLLGTNSRTEPILSGGACAIAVQRLYEIQAPIVDGAETDWFVAEEALKTIGVVFVRLLPDEWYRSRLANK